MRRRAWPRSQQAPPIGSHVVQAAFARRWSLLLGGVVQDALAATLLSLPGGPLDGVAAAPPPLGA